MQTTLHKYRCTVHQPAFLVSEYFVTAHSPTKAAELARVLATRDDGDLLDVTVMDEPECSPEDCEVADAA